MTLPTLFPLRVGLVVVMAVLCAPAALVAQGLVQGVQQGAQAGNKAAGPVGGVLGGAIGGVVGVFTGVLGVGNNAQQPAAVAPTNAPPAAAKQPAPSKPARVLARSGKGARPNAPSQETTAPAAPEAHVPPQEPAAAPQQTAVLTQEGAPQLTAEQIVANSDANIEQIKAELNLTPVQEKNWPGFSSAMHYLSHNGADRLNLRMARAKRDPPEGIIEQMRNEAQFLNDRAIDQRNVADAAEPLFTTLDDKQKAIFIEEMVRLSHERGLD
jgi:hypothetical protein